DFDWVLAERTGGKRYSPLPSVGPEATEYVTVPMPIGQLSNTGSGISCEVTLNTVIHASLLETNQGHSLDVLTLKLPTPPVPATEAPAGEIEYWQLWLD